MHQQLWGYKVELKSVSRGTGGKKVEYHCSISLVPRDYRGLWNSFTGPVFNWSENLSSADQFPSAK